MAGECTVYGVSANQLVEAGMGFAVDHAASSFNAAAAALSNLSDFTVQGISFEASYSLAETLVAFDRPTTPTLPSLALTLPTDIGEIPDTSIDQVVFYNPPAEPSELTNMPTLRLGDDPGSFDAADPGEVPDLSPVVIPDEPDWDMPTPPDFVEIDVDSITLLPMDMPEFEGIRPTRDFEGIDNTFQFEEEEYSSALHNVVFAKLQEMAQGGNGLPAAIEQALFDRAGERDEQETLRAVQEAYHEAASRGHDRPPGATDGLVSQIRQQGAARRSATSREIAIQQHNTYIMNLQFAVTQGVAYEQILIAKHMNVQERAFQVQRAILQASIDVLNTKIALFNADQEAYRTDAAVFRERIEAKKVTVEIMRAEIEAQKVKGEINRDLAAAYDSECRAFSALVESYRTRVDAKRVENEINAQRIEAYRAKVFAFAERVRAYAARWEGYRASVQAAVEVNRGYELAANVYATRVAAVDTKNRNAVAQGQMQIAERDLALRGLEAKLKKYLGELQAQVSSVEARARGAEAESRSFVAEASVEESRQQSNQRAFALRMEEERTRKELALKSAEVSIQQAVQLAQMVLNKLQGVAQVSSQLAASAMSAVHVQASISGQSSSGCSVEYRL